MTSCTCVLEHLHVRGGSSQENEAILCKGSVSFHFRAHGLRRTAASFTGEAGEDRFHIAHVLTHRSVTHTTVTAIYDRYRYDREKRRHLKVGRGIDQDRRPEAESIKHPKRGARNRRTIRVHTTVERIIVSRYLMTALTGQGSARVLLYRCWQSDV